MGAIILVDAFWGDGCKGKFCAFFSLLYNAPLAVRAGTGSNAGHSIYINNEMIKCRMLPLGWINKHTDVLISSGVVVNPDIFLDELELFKLKGRAFIDWRCPIISKDHIKFEENDETLKLIDSTKSGSGKARADFILRNNIQAKDVPKLKDYIIDGIEETNKVGLKDKVIIEGSQGTFLSLYASDRYPYVSSDNCTTNAFLDDTSLNWKLVDEVILLVKSLPTCVGRGNLPFEMSKEDIISNNLVEYGVNTGRFKRRSSQIDWDRLRYSVLINGPTKIALTYCDQYDSNMRGVRNKDKITLKIWNLIEKIENIAQIPVCYIETGKDFSDIIIIK